jgi:hypothetical protein
VRKSGLRTPLDGGSNPPMGSNQASQLCDPAAEALLLILQEVLRQRYDTMHDVLDRSVECSDRLVRFPIARMDSEFQQRRTSPFLAKSQCPLREAYIKYRTNIQRKGYDYWRMYECLCGSCGPFPGYPISSLEEVLKHEVEVHGVCCR